MTNSAVAIVKCTSYEQSEVTSAVQKGLDLLGGIKKFVNPDEKIVLKPNVLWGTDPEKCVTTHPSVFQAIATIIKEQCSCRLFYGDSPGGLQTSTHAMKKPGFSQIANNLGIEQSDFDHGESISHPDGIISKRLFLAKGILEANGVISLPKLKTHGLTRFTGAIKNQYGCVPGMTKGQYHAQYPDIYDFSKLLADITAFIRPRLYIMDAVIGMEGNGPQSGDPRKIGALLFSTDAVAIDTIACQIINMPTDFVPTIKTGVAAKLGTSQKDSIELKGDSIDQFIVPDYVATRMPPVRMPKNRFLQTIKSHFTPRPVIDVSRCIRCGRCVQVCPAEPKAVFVKTKGSVPQYNYSRCIRCFCCHEMCPAKAIDIKSPFLKKILPVLSYLSLLMVRNQSRKKPKKPK